MRSPCVSKGAAPGTITVSAFSFTSSGSTYSVTPGENGTLIGTRNGQPWQTWQLMPTGVPGNLPDSADPAAATALRILTSLNTQKTAPPDTLLADKSPRARRYPDLATARKGIANPVATDWTSAPDRRVGRQPFGAAAWCLPGRHPGICGSASASSCGIGTLALMPLSDRCIHDMTPCDGMPSL
jgi:hypothetical protein